MTSARRADLRVIAARRLLEGGRVDAAEATLKTATEAHRARADALGLDGEIALRKRDYDKACGLFTRAISVGSDGEDDIAALHAGLAAAQVERGHFEDAARGFLTAVSDGAVDTRTWLGLSQVLFAMSEWDALAGLADQAHGMGRVDTLTVAAVSLMSAIASFVRGDLESCHHEIGRCFARTGGDRQSIRNLVAWRDLSDSSLGVRAFPESKALMAALSYHDYIAKLLDYRSANAEMYDASDARPLHIIGDSHCLAPAHTSVEMEGERRRVVSHPVIGAKAWHLAPALNPAANARRATFERLAHSVSDHDPVITMFGEIDCRVNEGLFPLLKDRPENAVELQCRDLADAHVGYLSKVLARKRRVVVYGVPAPDRAAAAKAPGDGRDYLRLVATFNRCLGDAARAAGFGFLDPHGATEGADGVATNRWYFDGVHTSPALVPALLADNDRSGLDA